MGCSAKLTKDLQPTKPYHTYSDKPESHDHRPSYCTDAVYSRPRIALFRFRAHPDKTEKLINKRIMGNMEVVIGIILILVIGADSQDSKG